VALDAAALRASAELSAKRIGGNGNWLLALPLTHIAGLNVLIRALLAGSDVCPMPPGPFTAATFARSLTGLASGPRFTSLVPTQLARLLADGQRGIDALASFDAVLVGGAPVGLKLANRARRAGINLIETYGMTETAGGCVYDGQGLDGVTVTIDGTIKLGGPTLALGYLPNLTPKAVSDTARPAGSADSSSPGSADSSSPFEQVNGQRWFKTSDLGKFDPAGRLLVLGRADNAITTGGETISPEAVEKVLADFPGLAGTIVVGLNDAEWGELVTVVAVPANNQASQPSLAALRQAVKTHLGVSHAPRAVGWVDQLPELAPGKPNRPAARELARQLRAAGQINQLR
jgi:O-succinylbenzoic acid--CoA ligase